MDESAAQLSRALESVSTAIAQWTVDEHVQVDPSLPERFGERWRSIWVADVHERLAHLVQAVALQRSEIFDAAVRWAGAAFQTREVRTDDLRASLRCMRNVLETNMPAPMNGPLLDYVDHALTVEVEDAMPATFVGVDRPHGKLALQYLQAVLETDRAQAEKIIVDAAEAGVSVADLYLRVFQPALAEIGRMWHLNEINIADEHFAVALTETLMGRLRTYFDSAPRRGRRVLLMSIAGELHSIGVRMVADFFDMAGWDTVSLGPNMPTDEVFRFMRDDPPHLLALSVSTTLHLRTLAEFVQTLRADDDLASMRVIIGGRPLELVPNLWKEIGADGAAGSPPEAVALADRLVSL